jgi:hypothetical protein
MVHSRAARVAALFLLAAVTTAARVSAHDIPRDVTVQAFARPDGHALHLLVRVPLKAIMDIEFPRRSAITSTSIASISRCATPR